jgi:hypothetical protein
MTQRVAALQVGKKEIHKSYIRKERNTERTKTIKKERRKEL